MTQFDTLVKMSPCPVSVEPIKFSKGIYRTILQEIIIADSISLIQRIAVLTHEIGHALHYKRKCRCFFLHNDFLCEYHAHRFAMRFMLRYRLKGALRYTFNCMKREWSTFGYPYDRVTARLQQEKIWQRCRDYLGIN
ncbi:hypothetical protein KAR91_39070 [Candidatus Pacearchaeota archaeon]|nr:hypothetical protein [Candidatus Pacearchaeota archaeon]